MFVFWKIWHALFSWNTRFEIHPFALLPTITWNLSFSGRDKPLMGDENLVGRDSTWRLFSGRGNKQIFGYWGTTSHPPLGKTLLKVISNLYRFFKNSTNSRYKTQKTAVFNNGSLPKILKNMKKQINFKKLWPLFMDGVQLFQGYRATMRRQLTCHH